MQTREEIQSKSNIKNQFDLEGELSPPKICKKNPTARLEPPKLLACFDFYGNYEKLENSKQRIKNMRFH